MYQSFLSDIAQVHDRLQDHVEALLWMFNAAEGKDVSSYDFALRMLHLNFGSVFTTAMVYPFLVRKGPYLSSIYL